MSPGAGGARVDSLRVQAYRIPTATPESDGTFEWDATTLVAVHAAAGGRRGFGYTYADTSTAELVRSLLAGRVEGRDAFAIEAIWADLVRSVRNLGRRGIAAMAVSAVDAALWDLKGKLLEASLADLLGRVREAAPLYGSGGFTSYGVDELRRQLGEWAAQGLRAVKMKIGRDADADRRRVRAARDAIGPACALFVDANGAYSPRLALHQAEDFAASRVAWFEEPVSSDDLRGLRFVRERTPADMEVAAGEYGYELEYFDEMLAAGAVDVLQADATRCGGITGFLKAAVLCESRSVPLSAHCAPSLHAHLGCAVLPLRHLEYFYDHVRIESMLFEGVAPPRGGALVPDRSRPGLGFELKERDAARFAA